MKFIVSLLLLLWGLLTFARGAPVATIRLNNYDS